MMFLGFKRLKNFALMCASLAILALIVSCSGTNKVTPSGIPEQDQGNPAVTQSNDAEKSWRLMMLRFRPENGCAVATYPELRWRAMPCGRPPSNASYPARGIRPATVGNTRDWSALVPMSAPMDTAEGFFPYVSVTHEHNPKTKTANVYSLQLNSNTFTTVACKGAPKPNQCRGWQQFQYRQDKYTHGIYIEYWLLNYYSGNKKVNCPHPWSNFPQFGALSCHHETATTVTPREVISSLAKTTLVGLAPGFDGDKKDLVGVYLPQNLYIAVGDDLLPDLNKEWQTVEFNVVGNCCGNEAFFTPPATLIVRTEESNGTNTAPTCNGPLGGDTAETNNLNLTGAPTKWPKDTSTSIIFQETNGPTTSPTCSPQPGS